MNVDTTMPRRFTILSYTALTIGVICFFMTFVPPTRIAMIGSRTGDYVIAGLTIIGAICSIIGLAKKTEKNTLPLIALLLSLSFPLFMALWFILTVMGVWDFAP